MKIKCYLFYEPCLMLFYLIKEEQLWSTLRDKAMEEDLTEFEKTGSLYQAGNINKHLHKH